MATWKWIVGAVVTGGGLLLLTHRRAVKEEKKESKELGKKVADAAAQKASEAGIEAPPTASAAIRKGVELINLGRINEYQLEAVVQQLNGLGSGMILVGKILELVRAKQPQIYASWETKRRAPVANQRQFWLPQVRSALARLVKEGASGSGAPTKKVSPSTQAKSPPSSGSAESAT